jgi:hypothetical protein
MHTSAPIHRSTRVTMGDGSVVSEVWEHRPNEICRCGAVGRWVNPSSEYRLCTACQCGWYWGVLEADNPALLQLLAQLAR